MVLSSYYNFWTRLFLPVHLFRAPHIFGSI